MSLRRSVLYSLCVPSAFGRRAGFDVNTSHDFPQVCWQRSPWEQVGLEMEGLGPEPCVSQGFSSAHWPSLPYLGWGWVPSCSSRRLEGWV